MKLIYSTVFLCLGVAATFAQEVHFDYNCSINFSSYGTYR